MLNNISNPNFTDLMELLGDRFDTFFDEPKFDVELDMGMIEFAKEFGFDPEANAALLMKPYDMQEDGENNFVKFARVYAMNMDELVMEGEGRKFIPYETFGMIAMSYEK